MKSKLLRGLQDFAKSMVVPVKFMTITATALAIAAILKLDFFPASVMFLGNFATTMMQACINNLSIIFCVGLTATLAKQKKVESAILALFVYFMFLAANNTWLSTHQMLIEASNLTGTGQKLDLGFQIVDMGVFLGILLGGIVGYMHNRFSGTEFIDIFKVYGGTRFTLILMIPIDIVLAIGLCYVWPLVQSGIDVLTAFMVSAGGIGVFVYGFMNKILIPTGLHHLLWMPMFYSKLGGTAEIAGTVYEGAANIWFAEMANAGTLTALDTSSRFMLGGFTKMFGTIGLALAFIHCASPKYKNTVKGFLLPSVFVAVVANITEPFDFTYAFLSPLLWVVNAVLTGAFEMICFLAGVQMNASGGIIKTITMDLVISPHLTHIVRYLLIGVVGIGVWYAVFTVLIKRLNLPIPGNDGSLEEDGAAAPEENTQTKHSPDPKAALTETIVEGLGGKENITYVTNCFTRLRVDVVDAAKVNQDILNQTKPNGIYIKGTNVQVVYGMKVGEIKEEVCRFLGLES